MIIWELITGRKPFWDKSHDTDLIIEICDGVRPPIVENNASKYQSKWKYNSADIGPITINNPDAIIYKSRPLSVMIKYAESTRSLKNSNRLFDK
ncbi:hypothetical protein RhiirA5_439658 [Rhizophagus irregularis]|uniref:Protein kinase domain-containing protein n=1 Tax=Rhizophagus irregularis TaxID=588596 RepID=A0A2N0NHJ6_9GLOM|nr:hypothetical protein RhiirA5_439658 [Rhizophagus irregularis]